MAAAGTGATDAGFLFLARDAGLQQAVSAFPEDLRFAVQTAAQLRNTLFSLDDPAAEPWPPMVVRSAA